MIFLSDHKTQASFRADARAISGVIVGALSKKDFGQAAKILSRRISRTPWLQEALGDFGLVISPTFQVNKQEFIEFLSKKVNHSIKPSLSYPFGIRHFIESVANHEVDTLVHLVKSLVEEYDARFAKQEYKEELVEEILYEALSLNHKFKELKSVLPVRHEVSELVKKEISKNFDDLFIIATEVRKIMDTNVDTFGLAEMLYSLQVKYWQMVTSTDMIIMPDYNYRRHANALPGTHHSLRPFPDFDDDIMMNPLGEYTSFIEATSCSLINGYSNTFGFIHLNHIDQDGQPFQAEYPVMMIDERLLNVPSPLMQSIISYDVRFEFNHDLWHHLLPVYADHFILHHPDAPIEFGGKLRAYAGFGRELRYRKDDYEVALGIGHRLTKEIRSRIDPDYFTSQRKLLVDHLREIKTLNEDSLVEQLGEEEAAKATTYLTAIYFYRSAVVHDIRKSDYKEAEQLISTMNISRYGLSLKEANAILSNVGVTKEFVDSAALRAFLNGTSASEPLLTQDGQVILDCLRVIINDAKSLKNSFVLSKWGTILWHALNMPQKKRLFGYPAVVTNRKFVNYGPDKTVSPYQLVADQLKCLEADIGEYESRYDLRKRTSSTLYRLFNILFTCNRAGLFVSPLLRRSITDPDDLKVVMGFFDDMYRNLYDSTYVPISEVSQDRILKILVKYPDIYDQLSSILFDYQYISKFATTSYGVHIKHRKQLSARIMTLS